MELILPESIFEYCTSKVGQLSDISKWNIWFNQAYDQGSKQRHVVW